jgi:NAD(P)H-nitrite reductase large subunit
MKIVIIGGSAAGHNAAIKIRQKYQDAGVTVISEEVYPFYDRKKLLDYWSGKAKEKELFLISADSYGQQNINFLKEAKVISINPSRRSVSYKIAEKRTSVDYDFLVIASGCRSPLPEIEGINKSGVFRFGGLADFKELRSAVMLDAVCLIGVNHLTSKIIEAVTAKGIEVKLITTQPQENFPEMVEAIDSEVVEIIGDSGVQAVKLKEGKILGVSWVGVTLPMKPCADFLKDTEVEIIDSAIAVDENLRTSIPDIFACGSVCRREGEAPGIKLWEDSLAEGLSVAENILKS